MSTPDNEVAEGIARSIDGRIFRLQEERASLGHANSRITEIDAQLAILQAEKARIDPRRPPRPVTPGEEGPVSELPPRGPRA